MLQIERALNAHSIHDMPQKLAADTQNNIRGPKVLSPGI